MATPVKKPAPGKPTAAAPPPPPEELSVASSNPDEMVQGGLMDDFDGLVTKARYCPWDYNGTLDHHVLGVGVTIQPYNENGEPEGDPFVQTYSAGDLEQFAPSMDGKLPVDLQAESETGEEYEGIYALRVGSKAQLNNNTNWAQYVMALLEAGFDRGLLTPAVTWLEGVFGHWNRIPQKKRAGLVQAESEGQRRRNEILVITELKEVPTVKVAKPGPKGIVPKSPVPPVTAVPKGKTPVVQAAAEQVIEEAEAAAEAVADPFDAKLYDIVAEAVTAAGEAGLAKGKLAGSVIRKVAGTEKAKAVKRVGEVDFLESGGNEGAQWVYDADSGTLFAV